MAGPRFITALTVVFITLISYCVAAPLKERRSQVEEVVSPVGGSHTLVRRYDPMCFGAEGTEKAQIEDVHKCVSRLLGPDSGVSLSATEDEPNVICTEGNSEVVLLRNPASVNAPQTVVSIGSDVEKAIAWVFDHCTLDGVVGGSQAANGNGDLLVIVRRKGAGVPGY